MTQIADDFQARMLTSEQFHQEDKKIQQYIYQLLTLNINNKEEAKKAIEQRVKERDSVIILVENNEGEIRGCLLGSKTTDQTENYYIGYSLGIIESGSIREQLLNILRETLKKQNATLQKS